MPDPKPQLHNSDIHLLLACGERFVRRKLRGEREPISTPLILGKTQHHVAYADLTQKLESGELMPTDAVKDLAADRLQIEWDSGPLLLDQHEQAQGLEAVKGRLKDVAVDAAVVHHTELAPKLSPAPNGLEWSWVLKADGYPYDLAGQVDVKEHIRPNGTLMARIRDLKFVKKAPAQYEVEQSSQLTVYTLAVKAIDGLDVQDVWIDALVKPTKTLGTRLVSLYSTRTEADRRSFVARFEQAIVAIEKSVFMPANPAEPWAPCRQCGFAPTCRYYTNRPTTIYPNPTTGETHGTTTRPAVKSVIKAGSEEWTNATVD